MKSNLIGANVIVTGGGSGIGKAVAARFAEEGANVLITGRTASQLIETSKLNPHIRYVVADMQKEEDIRTIVQRSAESAGHIDILVNNAGMFASSPLREINTELMENVFRTNVFGPAMLVRESLPFLEKSKGSIVNISSTYGHKPSKRSSIYAASKAALEQLTKSWALELAPSGIRANAIAPGPTESGILEKSGLSSESIEKIKISEIEMIPLSRRGTAEEVAEWVIRLSLFSSKWVTGQVISIDGGLSIA